MLLLVVVNKDSFIHGNL